MATVDPVLRVQELARIAARRYGLKVRLVVVSFVNNIEHGGQVELRDEDDFFVEVHSDYKDDLDSLMALMGHELAHIHLFQHSVRLEATQDNEVMTDMTAVAFGFAPFMANTNKFESWTEETEGQRINHTRHSYLGYLSPREIGYVLGRLLLSYPPGTIHEPSIEGLLGAGMKAARDDMVYAPMAASRWTQRTGYKMRRLLSRLSGGYSVCHAMRPYWFEGGRVVFRCPRCTTGMRLNTSVKCNCYCPRCSLRLDCST